jgi:hypothetical protein
MLSVLANVCVSHPLAFPLLLSLRFLGSYGAHSGGRGGMAQHNLAKMGRFHHGGGGGGHHAHSHHNQPQQLNGSMMGAFGGANGIMQFPSNASSSFQNNGGMRGANPAGSFNLAAAMTGRPFMAAGGGSTNFAAAHQM